MSQPDEGKAAPPALRVVPPPAMTPTQPRWLIENWRDHVVFKSSENGTLAPRALQNAIALLLYRADLAGLFVLNSRTRRLEVKFKPPWVDWPDSFPRPIAKADVTLCAGHLERTAYLQLSTKSVAEAIESAARARQQDPVAERLAAFTWDGRARLDHWLETYLGADDNSLSRIAGAKWLIAGAARIISPGAKFDHMLVLEGPQGAGKSTALRTLADALGEDCFTDRLSRIDQKDSCIELLGRVIVELAELTVLRKADYDEAKGFLSRLYDDIRLPWDSTVSRLPRGCIFAGTINPDGLGWLRDPTGNRRYWPVVVGDIDLERLKADALQLWAEAKARYDAGETWWIDDPTLIAELAIETADRLEADPWEDRIRHEVQQKPRVRIDKILEALGVEASRQTLREQRRVGACLRRLGWTKKNVRASDGRQEKWWMPSDE